MANPDELIFDGGLNTPPDRRRPGRLARPSSELLPLMRSPAPLGIEMQSLGQNNTLLLPERMLKRRVSYAPHKSDDLRAARGVMMGFAMSLGFWLACFLALGLWVWE